MAQGNTINLGFANVYLTPFSDANFTKNLAKQFIITPSRIDAADEVIVNVKKEIETLITGSGGKVIFTVPNEESGIATIPVLAPLAEPLLDLVFPDAVKVIDGSKTKTELFDRPGLLLSEWQNMVHVEFRPLDAKGIELPPNNWSYFPLAIIKPDFTDSKSASPGKVELQIISIGGEKTGCPGEIIGSVDLSANVDLSAGATDKLVDLSIDGVLFANINMGQNAVTTANEILDFINEAVGFIVATLELTTNFLKIVGIQQANTVILDDPTAGVTGFVAIFGGAAPATNTGTATTQVPVYGLGDETAV